MSRENIIKLTTTALTFPILFLLLAYVTAGGMLSILTFISYLLLAVVGGLIDHFVFLA
ncbi:MULTISPECIES: hypothetical protein [Colwellia]|uniref:Uncharacterized protein n=1 Tax=Colwellia marinimaniae TaxID=1513592 RepID=A0ABQ0MS32_9GAMM|nr:MULTISPECIES: hypothetical protein [Colwellia]GAW95179.1 hypothetical protein MTCD1_00778 [Colwellia marinimaniae]